MSRNTSIAAVVTVLLISTMLVPLMSQITTAVHSGTDSQPPASGNWNVNTPNNKVTGETLIVNGSIIISKTSSLLLENSTVLMNKTGAYISVWGNLTLVNTTISVGTGASGYTVVFGGVSNVTMTKSIVSNTDAIYINTTGAFSFKGSSVLGADLVRFNTPISVHNSTFMNVNLSLNATVKVYNCTTLGYFNMAFTPNGSAVIHNYLNVIAKNGTGAAVAGASVTLKDYYGATIGSASTDGAGKAKNVAVKIEFMNATQYLSLFLGLVNMTVIKGTYHETVWSRMSPDMWVTVDTSDKAPIAILNPIGASATYVPVQFNASMSFDVEGPIFAYSWDFGDGSTAQTPSPLTTHTYMWPGNYRVSLTVTDPASQIDTTHTNVHVDWVIDSPITVKNRVMEMDANINVLDGGSLTLKNVTLAFNCSYNDEYQFVIHTGGAINILDGDSDPSTAADQSSITSGRISLGTLVPTTGRAQIVIENGTQAIFSNSHFARLGWDTVSGGGMVVGSDGAQFTGCTFESSSIGIALRPFDNDKVAISVHDCVFENNLIGIAIRQSSGPVELGIDGCQFIDNSNFGLDLPSGTGVVKVDLIGCEISGSNTGLYGEGIGVYNLVQTQVHHNSLGLDLHGIVGNIDVVLSEVELHSGSVGIMSDHTMLIAKNCTIYNESIWDLSLDDMSIFTMQNCSFDKAGVLFLDPTAQIMVYNYLSVVGKWPNGKVIPATFMNITNSTGASVFAGLSGATGRVEYLSILYYMMNSTTTVYADTMLDVNVSIYGKYHNKTAVNVNATKYLSLVITDTDKPQGGIIINNGTSICDSYLVGLTLSYSDVGSGVEAIALSNFPFNASNTFWEAPTHTTLWVLQPQSGLQTVYLMVRDNSGAVSSVFQDSITVDTVLPRSAVTGIDPYQKTGTFQISWAVIGDIPASISSYIIQYSSDGTFWQDWLFDVNFTSAQWAGSQEGDSVYFRSIAKDLAGNMEMKTGYDVLTMVDSVPPQSSLMPLALYHTDLTLGLSWTGYDRTSHISSYVIEYCTDISSPQWTTLSAGVTGSSGQFLMPQDATYYLRIRGTDKAGNIEAKASDVYDVKVILDTTLPTVSDPNADAKDFTAVVSWTTSELTQATLYYGKNATVMQTARDMVAATGHSITLTQLEQSTKYYYTLVISDVAGNTVVDDNSGNMYTFTTLARFGTLEGIVSDQVTGKAVKNAAVFVNGIYRALTNSTGGYTIFLPQGTYDIMVSQTDYETSTESGISVETGNTIEKNIQLALKPKNAGTLLVIANADGKPLAGAAVVVRLGADTVLMGSTDSQGRFSAIITPGDYLVLVTMPGYGSKTQSANVTTGAQTTSTLVLEELPEQTSPFMKQTDLITIIIACITGLIILLFIAYLVYTRFAPKRKAPAKKAEEEKEEKEKKDKKDKSDKKKDEKEEDEEEEEVVECPSCGTLTGVKDARCPECGESLYEVVSGDGEVMEEEAAFDCPFCGHEMELEEATCPECNQEVPQHYKDEFKQMAAETESAKKSKKSAGGKTEKAKAPAKKKEAQDDADEDEEAVEDGAGEDESEVEVQQGDKKG